MSHRNLHHSFLDSTLRAIYQMPRERWLARFAGALSAVVPVLAFANPTGGQVVAGSATIGTAGSNGVVVDQNSQRAAINWQQFSIGSNEYVQFNQPNSSSVVLNRVIGSNPSSIFGNIRANGQVFLINPNGILFAPGSSLDVSSLTASTLDISDSNFMARRYLFSKDAGAPDASVINQGAISVTHGGYVVLSGDYVENDGVIQAQTGRVVLASARRADLTLSNSGGLISYQVDAPTLARLAGVDNTGSITAQGGMVVMTADVANALTATAVNNSGFITAHSVSQHGGEIVLLSQGGGIENSGTLDASASQTGVAGGTIVVRGNGHTQLTPTSKITAGGDQAAGGFIELSGHTLGVRGLVKAGQRGSLLLDPAKIHITAGNGVSQVSTGTGTIGTGFIASHLQSGNVAVVASNSISRTGGSHISATGTGRLTLEIGTVPAGGSCGIGGICVGTGFPTITPRVGTIDLTGLTINVGGLVSIQDSQGGVTVGTITANGGIFVRAGQIHVNGNLSAPGNEVSLAAAPGLSRGLIKVAAGKVLSGASVNLGMSDSYGGVISAGAINATQRINIDLSDHAGSSVDLIKTGALTAPQINVFATGKKEQIVTGAITANSPHGPASVALGETIGSNGTGIITVNGAINVTGRPAGSHSGFGGVFGPQDLPPAAQLDVDITGTGAFTGNIKLAGAVNVTAVGHAYSDASNNESGPVASRIQSGTGGLATTFISVNGSHGSASVAGDLTTHGPDAIVIVQAQKVAVHNVTVTGSGHHVHRSIVARASGGAYSSSNSAGQAELVLGGVPGTSSHSTPGISNSVKAGNITVSGKGVAEAELFASNVSAGNISVTATAAHGKITQDHGNIGVSCIGQCGNENSAEFYRGINNVQLTTGSISGGRASINIGMQLGNGTSQQATAIKTGALSVTGVGEANIQLAGKTVQTQALTAIATKGTEHGAGSSVSGVNTFVHTFKLNGGQVNVDIRSGDSGSNGSGSLLTRNGGAVTVTGGITATGPVASVNVRGQSIKITSNVAVTGSGGSLTSDTVFTSPSSPGYHVHFVGPGQAVGLNVQGGANGLVSIGGNVDVKGPGLVGVIVIGTTVKLHGFSASASAAENYSVLDTRISNTTTTFTGDSLAVIIDDVAGTKSAPAFTAATVTGNVDLGAKGDIHLATGINVSGSLVVHAGGDVIGSVGNAISRFNLLGSSQPHANGGHSGGGPSNSAAAFLPAFNAQADAIGITAGGNILMSKSRLTIGSGSVSTKALASDTGDATLLAGLAGAGLAPLSTAPNGFFKAGGSLELGSVSMSGSYLYLQAADVSVAGKVTMPTGALVQFVPTAVTGSIDAEGTGAAGADLNLNDSGLFNVFPDGITLVLGGTGQSGAVTLGNRGTFDIGSDNLIVDTTGTITGLGNVISTGQVVSLSSLLNGLPPVTAGEIDPTSNTTGTGKDKQGAGQGLGGGGTGNQPSISQDTGNSSVCH